MRRVIQPECDACCAPATFEVLGHWGDVWAPGVRRPPGRGGHAVPAPLRARHHRAGPRSRDHPQEEGV